MRRVSINQERLQSLASCMQGQVAGHGRDTFAACRAGNTNRLQRLAGFVLGGPQCVQQNVIVIGVRIPKLPSWRNFLIRRANLAIGGCRTSHGTNALPLADVVFVEWKRVRELPVNFRLATV